VFDAIRIHSGLMIDQTFITRAVGGTPDWLQQHAADRDTFRQDSETDDQLEFRLRNIQAAAIKPSIMALAQQMIDDAGVSGTVAMCELRRDRAYLRTLQAMTGTGGVFTDPAGTSMRFAPTVPFPGPPFRVPEEIVEHRLIISGAASGGNNGTFTITGLFGAAAVYVNASGVAGTDATVTWSVQHRDRAGNILDGFRDAYCSRGDRCAADRAGFVLILPFGTTEALRLSVQELVRPIKAGGVVFYVERRVNP
jgi:hypothetical protein